VSVRLSLVSQPGVGTSVTLRLNAVRPLPRADAPPAAPPIAPGLSVLVVDDESMARHSMRLLLSELGCTVHLADSTEQAMVLARQHPIDVMLSDYRLRGEDSGVIAIESVRALHPAARAVLVTGDTEPGRIREADARQIPLLHKPVSLQDLLGALGPATP
jgi:CheY-like chemotaxis protein